MIFEVDTILKDKGIKITGKNSKLKRDLLKISDKILLKKIEKNILYYLFLYYLMIFISLIYCIIL